MRLLISNSSAIPIYEQIKKAIIDQIMSGELKEDEMLPSIRTLAKDIKISVMTIKKAYDQLEDEGYIVSIHGKGTFVSPKNKQLILEDAKREIEDHVIKILDIANKFNIDKNEIIDLFDIYGRNE